MNVTEVPVAAISLLLAAAFSIALIVRDALLGTATPARTLLFARGALLVLFLLLLEIARSYHLHTLTAVLLVGVFVLVVLLVVAPQLKRARSANVPES